ncbi:MAG TPA: phosphodiester glycosidase family protein [Allosphingosinicella sp.]
MCKYDSAKHRIEFFVEGKQGRPLRSFEALDAHLGPRVSGLLFAMNAGMYGKEGRPIGLYVEDGRQIRAINLKQGGGNFHLMPNGVFAVDARGRPSVTPSKQFRIREPRWATQSGPMLVIEGKLHPAFAPNGESLHIRNGVGVCGPTTAWFAISDEPVSFGRFARLFKDELGCTDALFLDGAVSSLWEPGARQDVRAPLGPIVAVFRR